MFNRFFIIMLPILLGTINKPLQAMYIPDLWEDIWKEDALRRGAKKPDRIENIWEEDFTNQISYENFRTTSTLSKIYNDTNSKAIVVINQQDNDDLKSQFAAFFDKLFDALESLLSPVEQKAWQHRIETLIEFCKKYDTEFNNLSHADQNECAVYDMEALLKKNLIKKPFLQRKIIEMHIWAKLNQDNLQNKALLLITGGIQTLWDVIIIKLLKTVGRATPWALDIPNNLASSLAINSFWFLPLLIRAFLCSKSSDRSMQWYIGANIATYSLLLLLNFPLESVI